MQILLEYSTKENTTKEEVDIQGRMATKVSHHKEDVFIPETKVSFMVIIFHVTILDIWLEIEKLMDRRIRQKWKCPHGIQC